uniref:Kinetochore protein NDC80 n=1 Tax=Culicoides sonorensis TaxID=179676 RepID=A0A336KMM2_CULSO
MPAHPRRTTELLSSTDRTSERKSRIALPIRRTTQIGVSATKRAQSSDRYSTRGNSLLPPPVSTAKKVRSLSQTPLQFQTPTTPGNLTPLSNSYLQSADKRGPIEDKLFIHQEAARITNFAICHNLPGFGKDTKLRDVTCKQFTGLVEYMLEALMGNRQPLSGIDNIVKALHTLDYPYTINKSWLKTPTAGHVFNHVVLMLGWLLNLVDPPLMPGGETELDDFECINNLVHDAEFPTIIYQKHFMTKARNGFKLWDLQKDDEFSALNQELVDLYISQTTHGTIKNLKQLDNEIVALETELKKLQTVPEPSSELTEHHDQLEKELRDLKRALEGKQQIIQQLKQTLATDKSIYENEKKILKQREAEIERLRSQIQTQSMSKDDLKQLIQENHILRQTIETEMKNIEKIEDENSSAPIEISRLVKTKVQKVNELNQKLFKLAKEFDASVINFNPSDYEVDSTSSDIKSQLKMVKDAFSIIKQMLQETNENYKLNIINVASEIDELKAKLEQAEKKLKKIDEKTSIEIKNQNQVLSDLVKKFNEYDETNNKKRNEQDQLKKRISMVEAMIETEKIANNHVEEEKQIMMKKFLEEQQVMLADLRKNSTELDQKLEYYRRMKVDLKNLLVQKQKDVKGLLDKCMANKN